MRVLGINALFHDPFSTCELPERADACCLATALGKPSVVLFRPTPPPLWGPPPGRRHTVLWKGRRSDPFADRPAPGLLVIHPPEVASALAGRSAAEPGKPSVPLVGPRGNRRTAPLKGLPPNPSRKGREIDSSGDVAGG